MKKILNASRDSSLFLEYTVINLRLQIIGEYT